MSQKRDMGHPMSVALRDVGTRGNTVYCDYGFPNCEVLEMLSPLESTAFAFDLTGTFLVGVEAVRSKREAERIETIREHILALEVALDSTEKMESAPGLKVAGMDYDELL